MDAAITTYKMRFPAIPWEKPVLVSQEGETRWACRVCIGLKGLHGCDFKKLFASEELAQAHINTEHLRG